MAATNAIRRDSPTIQQRIVNSVLARMRYEKRQCDAKEQAVLILLVPDSMFSVYASAQLNGFCSDQPEAVRPIDLVVVNSHHNFDVVQECMRKCAASDSTIFVACAYTLQTPYAHRKRLQTLIDGRKEVKNYYTFTVSGV